METKLKKDDLASIKSDIDKLDFDKLERVPSDLSGLKSEVGNLDVINWSLFLLI